MKSFDPADLITPIGIHDRHVGGDGQGAVIWLQGLHAEGVSIGVQAKSVLDHRPGPTDPEPPELQLPRMTVAAGEFVDQIPALRGSVNSVDGRTYKLNGVYYVRVSDRTESVRCSVVVHGNELAIEFTIGDLT